MNTAVDEARKLIETIPATATWDDIMYQFYVKQKLRKALEAENEGRVMPHEDVKKRLLQK
jgi:predicted transcriptional regulator